MPPTREANGQNEFRLSYLINLVAHFLVEQLGAHATAASGRTHPQRSFSSPLFACRESVRTWPRARGSSHPKRIAASAMMFLDFADASAGTE
jgi:hypothetical protein